MNLVLDTSAIIAILKEEPEAQHFAEVIEAADSLSISAASWLEASIVIGAFHSPKLNARLDELLSEATVTIEPFTVEQAQIARQAYRDYGRGSGHSANLNFGDCFAYALARTKRQPLLYKGDDFRHTDLRSAV